MKMLTACLGALALAISACGGGGGADEQVAGPCSVDYADPVLVLSSTAPVSELVLSSISINGAPANLQLLVSSKSSNVQVAGETLLCKLPCGFGTTEGSYTLTASATGYRAAPLSVTAKYATSIGNCPRTSSGSTNISVVLQPA